MTASARVLIVYPFLHHYRRGVFTELDRTPELSITFAADIVGAQGIETMDPRDLRSFVQVRTRRFKHLEFQTGVLALVVRGGFDVVIFLGHVASVSTWLAATLARIRGLRVLFWTIGWHRPENGAKRLIRLAFYRIANRLLLYGSIARDIGIKLGYPAERMLVIGNSISLGAGCEPDSVRLGGAPTGETIRVGAVARITAVKRFELLVAACEILRRRGHDVIIRLAGEGVALERLQQLAERSKVTLISHAPAYSCSDLADFYADIDATVVPQAIGLTAIQSLGFGVPAVSDDRPHTQMPEWEAIVPGMTGELYRHGDAVSLAEAILRAWALRRDPLCYARCRAAYVERWSPAVHAKKICEAITS